MEIHDNFTNLHFVILLTIFAVTNLIILKCTRQNWKALLGWKVMILAFIITLLGFLYHESSKSNDLLTETSGFPKYFYLKKSSLGKDAFTNWGIVRFDYINFLQNFILIFLLINIFKLILKRTFRTENPS